MKPSIVIDKDHVTIEGVRVPRPARMSPSQWLEFWEDANQMQEVYARGWIDSRRAYGVH